MPPQLTICPKSGTVRWTNLPRDGPFETNHVFNFLLLSTRAAGNEFLFRTRTETQHFILEGGGGRPRVRARALLRRKFVCPGGKNTLISGDVPNFRDDEMKQRVATALSTARGTQWSVAGRTA